MQLQTTDQYIRVCMKTWLLCEASVQAEITGLCPSQTLIKECPVIVQKLVLPLYQAW